MANYVLLYSGGLTAATTTEAERTKSMKAWGDWLGKLGAAVVDAGNPFTGKAKTIASDGKVSDGSGGTAPNGYSVLKADSLDKAVELAKGCPGLKEGGKVIVFETHKVM